VIALGIDPGTRLLGWGVVRKQGSRLVHVDHGVIQPDVNLPLAERLVQIDRELRELLERHQPDVGSVETLFFHKDAQAAAKLGHARGVVLLRLASHGVLVAEYAPARVKRTVVGTGQADKHQVAMMVRALLGLTTVPQSDAADALALAITHLRLEPLARSLGNSAVGPSAQRLAALIRGRGSRKTRALTERALRRLVVSR
jgi:crossover junction endodeoxyribonuclease RuvC